MTEPIRTAEPGCTCSHPLDCVCACHGRACDPTENACDLDFLPDDGGLARWGCAVCTPGQDAPHLLGCPGVRPVAPAPGQIPRDPAFA